MNKISYFLLTIISLFFLTTINGVVQNNSCSLKIQIVGLKSNKGKVLLQLFDEKEYPIFRKTANIKNNSCSVDIPDLKQGKYLIRYFHDENDNDKLDTNWFGIPTEGYGFSNNAVSRFGIPSINDRLFTINRKMEILLKIRY